MPLWFEILMIVIAVPVGWFLFFKIFGQFK